MSSALPSKRNENGFNAKQCITPAIMKAFIKFKFYFK
jgi:hypothetical protein